MNYTIKNAYQYMLLKEKVLSEEFAAPVSNAGAMSTGDMPSYSQDPKLSVWGPFSKGKKKKTKIIRRKTIETLKEEFKPFNVNDFNLTPAPQNVSIVIGRFAPFTTGHMEMLHQCRHPIIIAIIKGVKSSEDKEKNPFDYELQKEIIEKANPYNLVDIVKFETASVPYIISALRDKGYEVKEIWCGSDRLLGYQKQTEKYKKAMNSDIEVKNLERNEDDSSVKGVSASKVREALKDDDYAKVDQMMINLDKNLYDKMKQSISGEENEI